MSRTIEKAFVIFESPEGTSYAAAQAAAEAVKSGQLTEAVALSGRKKKICPAVGGKFTSFSNWGLPEDVTRLKVRFTNPSEAEGVVTVGEPGCEDGWCVTMGADIEFEDPDHAVE